jgi:hypothetical protein
MAAEESKVAAGSLGIIPNVYFDLIARVIPGCFFLFAISRVSALNPLKSIIDAFMPYDKVRESSTAWILIVISTGYVVGHLLSPFVRFLEERPKRLRSLEETSDSHFAKIAWKCSPPFWRCEPAQASGDLQKNYNRLRSQDPGLAALAIRIRAEYTMYGGFAVALAFTVFFAAIRFVGELIHHQAMADLRQVTIGNWTLLVVGVMAVPIMLDRQLHTWRRFEKTVNQLLEAVKERGTQHRH